MSLVDRHIAMAQQNFVFKDITSVLKDPYAKKELKILHDTFVLVPIDKAGNNVAVFPPSISQHSIQKSPHNNLLQCLQFFIDLVFNDKERKYLSCTDSGAHRVSCARRVDRRYSKDSVSSALKFLIENAYFEVGGKLF